MRSLIYKDIHSFDWTAMLLYVLPPIVVAALIVAGIYVPLFIALGIIIPAEFALSLWAADDKSKYHKYSAVLPIHRNKIVNKNFIMILATSLYALVVIQLGVIIGNITQGHSPFGYSNMFVLALFFIAMSICAFGMFLMMVLNYVYSSIVLGAFGGVIGGFSASLSEEHIFDFSFINTHAFLTNMNFYLAVIIISTLVLAVSWIASLVVYKKKEL